MRLAESEAEAPQYWRRKLRIVATGLGDFAQWRVFGPVPGPLRRTYLTFLQRMRGWPQGCREFGGSVYTLCGDEILRR